MDERAKRREVQSHPESSRRRCDRHVGLKVTRLTLGDLMVCDTLPALQGGGMGRQESAKAIVGMSTVPKGRMSMRGNRLVVR